MQIALFLLNNINLAFTPTGAELLSKNTANKKKNSDWNSFKFQQKPLSSWSKR